MRYRRSDIDGGCYFFTVNLANKKQDLLVAEIDHLRDAINGVKRHHPFKLDAMVVLPEHLHAVWTLPSGDKDFSMRWRLIKSGFSRALPKTERVGASRIKKKERGIWQRRFWEHWIRDDRDYQRHVDYVHYNPVKHGYVKRAADWPYSTIHEHIQKGLMDENWAWNGAEVNEPFGEY